MKNIGERATHLGVKGCTGRLKPVAHHYIMENYHDKEHVTGYACDRKQHVTRKTSTEHDLRY